jgi:hypothetical protein
MSPSNNSPHCPRCKLAPSSYRGCSQKPEVAAGSFFHAFKQILATRMRKFGLKTLLSTDPAKSNRAGSLHGEETGAVKQLPVRNTTSGRSG